MPLSNQDIGAILVKQSYISQEEMESAAKLAEKSKRSITDVLMEQNLLTSDLLEGALAEHYQLSFYDVRSSTPDPHAVQALPEAIARKFNIVVVQKTDKEITVATADPQAEGLEDAIRINLNQEEALLPEETPEPDAKSAKGKDAGKPEEKVDGKDGKKEKKEKEPKKKEPHGMSFLKKAQKKGAVEPFKGKITFVYAPKSAIESIFLRYRKPLATRFQTIVESAKEVAPEILVEIINDAIQLRASDIHFEPQGDIVVVRFRVDGVMHEAGRIPKVYYEGVVNRIKIESNMRIDEHFTPQDGAIRHKTQRGIMDIRVSMVPVVDGEKVVMRLLSEYVRTLTLGDLGFSEKNEETLKEAAVKPFGMILATGPTGSGKSTTLYGLIKLRNTPDVNISTIEDPVEYKIPGINHIQTNSVANLTFATGLRALVRQDPDVILVGEIRDGETADIAVNAALTGHLLFSTLHSNDAATAVPRLLEMGVESFLLASTLEVIIGQRLVRRICPQCRYSYSISAKDAHGLFHGAASFFKKNSATLYKGKGCDACGGTGYRGRIGIHELLVVTPEIEDLIIRRATSTEINVLARKQGMQLMFEDGFEKVLSGMTTIEELTRVAAPPDVVFSASKHDKKES